MVWLLVVLLIYAIVFVAGRAHSRYLDRQEAKWKFGDADHVFALRDSIAPGSLRIYVVLSNDESLVRDDVRRGCIQEDRNPRRLRLSREWWSSVSSNAPYV
jgi:hypothetical protein